MEVKAEPVEETKNTQRFLSEFTCRICLYLHKNNTKISGSTGTDTIDKMKKYLSIKVAVEDESKMWICKPCSQSLSSFHNFYSKVVQIQSSLMSLLSRNSTNLKEDIDLIQTTVGFARGKKKSRARSKSTIPEQPRRMSTRKRKLRSNILQESDTEEPNQEDRCVGVEGSENNDVAQKTVHESAQNAVALLKEENAEESPVPNTIIFADPLASNVVENDDESSLEDQDWVGQAFSFDVDSDDDRSWEPSNQSHSRTTRRRKLERQPNGGGTGLGETDPEAMQLSDEDKQCDTSRTKLRITATHGTEPKPKLPPSVRKMLRVEMNAKFVDFYGITCDICLKSNHENTVPVRLTKYQSFEALCAHMQAEHKERGYVKCCNCTMREKKRAERHMLLHTQPGSIFKCNICGKQLSSQQSFRCHILLHLPDSERPFQCDQCDRGFVTKADLAQHKRQHLPEEKRLCFTCDICGSRFTAEAGLVSHKQRVHDNVRPHLCDLCAKSFSSRCDMERHRSQIHGNVKREQCPECGKWFKGSSILKTHMRQHRGQLFKCQYCDKSYTVRSSWKAHLLKHSDEKPHKCPICEKTFKLPGTLKMHLNQHTGELPYSCPFCPKKFASSGNYYTHRKRMHRNEVAQLKEATEAALASNGLPPPSTMPSTAPTQSISEAIARTKEKVAAKAKTDVHSDENNPPPPANATRNASVVSNSDIAETSLVLPSTSTILSSNGGAIGTPNMTFTSAVNLSQGNNGGLLFTQSGRMSSSVAVPVAISSVSSNTAPLHVIPNVKKLPNVPQFAPGTFKIVRILSPEGTTKFVVGKEIVISNQPSDVNTCLSQDDVCEDVTLLSATPVS